MIETKQKRKPRKYTDEFKQQLVDLYHSGEMGCDCQVIWKGVEHQAAWRREWQLAVDQEE